MTGTPSEVQYTSHSTPSTPRSNARRNAAIVFSGRSFDSPRCDTTSGIVTPNAAIPANAHIAANNLAAIINLLLMNKCPLYFTKTCIADASVKNVV